MAEIGPSRAGRAGGANSAGAIAANVNGKDSWRVGNFGDQVLELKVMTASGEIITMPAAEVAKLRAKIEQPVIDRWIGEMKEKGIDGQALVDEARALIAKYSK